MRRFLNKKLPFVATGEAEKLQMKVQNANMVADNCKVSPGVLEDFPKRTEKNPDPIIIATWKERILKILASSHPRWLNEVCFTMKHEKIIPRGADSPGKGIKFFFVHFRLLVFPHLSMKALVSREIQKCTCNFPRYFERVPHKGWDDFSRLEGPHPDKRQSDQSSTEKKKMFHWKKFAVPTLTLLCRRNFPPTWWGPPGSRPWNMARPWQKEPGDRGTSSLPKSWPQFRQWWLKCMKN